MEELKDINNAPLSEDKMYLKISTNAHIKYRSSTLRPYRPRDNFNSKWYDKLKAIAGKIIEVETDYLFYDQFNTVPIKNVSDKGLRIMMQSIDYVINDKRIDKMRCNYCGKVTIKGNICPYCNKSEYLLIFSEYI